MELSVQLAMGIEPNLRSFIHPPNAAEMAYITAWFDQLDSYRKELKALYLDALNDKPDTHLAMFCIKYKTTHETYQWLLKELKK